MAFLKHNQQPGFEIELIRDLIPQNGYSDRGLSIILPVENIEDAIHFYKGKGIDFNSETYNTTNDGMKTIFFYGSKRELLQLVEREKSE